MDNEADVYVVRWGPAAGDDYSTQVFTAKAGMLAFIEKLQVSKNEELTYEVHFARVNAEPEDVDNEDDFSKLSDCIALGESGTLIWRLHTEQHQSNDEEPQKE